LRFAPSIPCLLLLVCACRGSDVRETTPIPDAALDLAPWERSWSPDETTTWHDGVVQDLTKGGDTRDENFVRGAGAKVELFAVAPDGTVSASPVGAVATTGADGMFRVGPGPKDDWIIRVSRSDMTTTTIGGGRGALLRGVVLPPPMKLLRLGLRDGHDLSGRVVDRAGNPVAGAHVVVSGEAYREERTTDADGRFSAQPPRGMGAVELDDPRFEHDETPTMIPETGGVKDVTVTARPAAPLTGWVAARDGTRLVGAIVALLDDPRVRARTRPDGRFELPLNDRRKRVVAFADGYGWRSCYPPLAGDLEFLLDPSTPVTGRIVDAEGRPVADARLCAVVHGYMNSVERVYGPKTDSDGTFRFSWMPRPWRDPASIPWIMAAKRGAGETAITPLEGPAKIDPSNAKLVITGVRNVAGRATRSDGSPVAGAAVEAKWGHWDGGIPDAEVSAFHLGESEATSTDADGRYRLDAVPQALHARIRCSTGGIVLEKAMEPSAPGAPFDFVFEQGRAIAGRVVGIDGKDVQGAIVVQAQLLKAQGTEVNRAANAAADGSFRFDALPSGEYQITAWGDRYDLTGTSVVDAGDEAVVVRMHRTASLTFRLVFDGDARPDAAVSLRLEPFGGGADVHNQSLDPAHFGDGITSTGVVPGAWTLHAWSGLWRCEIGRIDVQDDEKRTIDVHLVKTMRLAAKLLGPDGGPRAATTVVASPVAPTKGLVVSATSASDGTIEFTGLLPGKWLASIDAPGAASMRQEFEVTESPSDPVVLRMPPCGAILVRVGPDDAKGALVLLSDETGKPLFAWTDGAATPMSQFRVDAEGRASLRGVRAGKVNVEVRSSGSTLQKSEIVVAAGGETSLEVK